MKDRMKIENQITINKLIGLEYDFVIAQLCVLNNKPYEDMKIELDNLIDAGLYIVICLQKRIKKLIVKLIEYKA